MTFWHWSSVTPYTSSYEFAGSCVFDKQSPGRLLLQPPTFESPTHSYNSNYDEQHNGICSPFICSRFKSGGQALSRSYGRFFAEFLGDLSFVRLALLELTTCVGLRYGQVASNLRSFSRKSDLLYLSVLRQTSSLFLRFAIKSRFPDLPGNHLQSTNVKSNNAQSILDFVTPSKRALVMEY